MCRKPLDIQNFSLIAGIRFYSWPFLIIYSYHSSYLLSVVALYLTIEIQRDISNESFILIFNICFFITSKKLDHIMFHNKTSPIFIAFITHVPKILNCSFWFTVRPLVLPSHCPLFLTLYLMEQNLFCVFNVNKTFPLQCKTTQKCVNFLLA